MMAQYDADPYLQQLFNLIGTNPGTSYPHPYDPYAEGQKPIPPPIPDTWQELVRGKDGKLVDPYSLSPQELRELGYLAEGQQPPEKNKRGPR